VVLDREGVVRLHVEVTAEDIEKGVCQDSDSCPIALAVHRLPGIEEVCVDNDVLWVRTAEGKLASGMPAEAAKFVDSFDNRGAVQPFSFDIEVEPEVDDDEYPDDEDGP
jgi:hypothetical protein